MKRLRWLIPLSLMVVAAVLLSACGTSPGTSPTVSAAAANGPRSRVLIGFATQPGPAEAQLVTDAGGAVKATFDLVPVIAAQVPGQAVAALARDARVAYVEEDAQVHASQQTLPWGIARIHADQVWPTGVTGGGAKVAVIDTGIDYNHPDLAANYQGGVNVVTGTSDPLDDNGHGTHVSGIVAAVDNSEGVVGAAPTAGLYAVKVLDAMGSGYLSDVIAGLQWCAQNGMDVANMSLGTTFNSRSLNNACNAAYNAGVLLVAASGNSGAGTVEYPAGYSSVIAVGATDSNDSLAYFSNFGKAQELVAPGVDILSTMPTYPVYLNLLYGFSTNYDQLSGTSMATPHVSGTAALVKSGDPALTNKDIRARLQSNADDLGASGWDKYYGYGLVNAQNTVANTNPPSGGGKPGNGGGKGHGNGPK